MLDHCADSVGSALPGGGGGGAAATRLISSFIQATPGAFSTTPPADALSCIAILVGGGGGRFSSTFASGGGAACVRHAFVPDGQLTGVVGARGTPNVSGTDTTLVIPGLTLRAAAGQCTSTGGLGGTVAASVGQERYAGGTGTNSPTSPGSAQFIAASGQGPTPGLMGVSLNDSTSGSVNVGGAGAGGPSGGNGAGRIVLSNQVLTHPAGPGGGDYTTYNENGNNTGPVMSGNGYIEILYYGAPL